LQCGQKLSGRANDPAGGVRSVAWPPLMTGASGPILQANQHHVNSSGVATRFGTGIQELLEDLIVLSESSLDSQPGAIAQKLEWSLDRLSGERSRNVDSTRHRQFC